MKTDTQGRIVLMGIRFDNPLDGDGTYPKRNYKQGKESARISFESFYLDSYVTDGVSVKAYGSYELKALSNGRMFIDGRELKDEAEIETAKSLFDGLRKLKLV